MNNQLTVSIGQYSSAGRKPVNQDFYGALVPAEPMLALKGIAAAIADGISTSDVSQIASQTAVRGFLEDYYSTSEAWSVKTSASRVLSAMNSWLYAQSQRSVNRFDKDKGYICTFSAIVFKSASAHLFHSGDSRIYRLTGERLEQLSRDHRRMAGGQTSYLTRALGIHAHLELDYQQLTVSTGEVFVLATDGVYEFINDSDLSQVLAQTGDDLDATARLLVDMAYQRGSDDNLTVQIIRIDSLPEHNLLELHQQAHELSPPPPLSPRMLFDGYRIIRELYISSRSHVFLAEDTITQEQVVIKTASSEQRHNPDYLEALLMEDWIARRIDNAHVLKAIDVTRKRHYLYTVTEYIAGKTLTQWLIDNPSPDIETVRELIEQIAAGLQAFHRQEMVHQDLRPENILIGACGTVKIIDFGATKVSGLTEIVARNEGIVGTAQYTAPEYFLGQTGSTRSDLFSLGVLAYQMLSGELPYGNRVAQSRSIQAQRRLNYQSLVCPGSKVPGWVDYAIAKAVHIDPLKRYREVAEFIYDLRNPNPAYLSQTRPPLAQRDPVLFWQLVSCVLFCALVYQLVVD